MRRPDEGRNVKHPADGWVGWPGAGGGVLGPRLWPVNRERSRGMFDPRRRRPHGGESGMMNGINKINETGCGEVADGLFLTQRGGAELLWITHAQVSCASGS